MPVETPERRQALGAHMPFARLANRRLVGNPGSEHCAYPGAEAPRVFSGCGTSST